jgi:hypothetical protein
MRSCNGFRTDMPALQGKMDHPRRECTGTLRTYALLARKKSG